jgi:hypothetical protein
VSDNCVAYLHCRACDHCGVPRDECDGPSLTDGSLSIFCSDVICGKWIPEGES